MSVNRVLKKRRQQTYSSQQLPLQSSSQSQQVTQITTQQIPKLQQQFSQYQQLSQYNPPSYISGNPYVPYNKELHNRFRLPLSIMLPPVSYQMQPVEKSADKIPRCGSCRAYMNYYNQIKQKGYRCFVCGRDNGFMHDYRVDLQSVEVTNTCYHVLGGENVYAEPPKQNAYLFLIDLNCSSAQSKMISYLVTVAKQVLSRQDLNQTQIYFYTYDEVIHEYDFSGDQVKCTVFDQTIKQNQRNISQNSLGAIREKLFQLLDNLEEICQANKKQGSNFFRAFQHVFEVAKRASSKIFIFQSNQAISGEQMMNENAKKNPNSENQSQKKSLSLLQSKNKKFFATFIETTLLHSISCSFFIFQKSFKNIKVFSDFCKLTNSELNVYRKQSPEELVKFYYDFYYLLGATYYSDVKMEMIICPGWFFVAVYGNLYRIKQHITFKFGQIQPSKKVVVNFLPQDVHQLPYFTMQVITNYCYNRQHYMTVNTMVIPLTTNLQKLYSNQNFSHCAVALHRSCLSSLRLEQINLLKNKVLRQISAIWQAACAFYKKNMPSQVTAMILSCLGMLKSQHFQLDSINQTIAMDVVISQRNLLQSCDINQSQNFFSPYLFNLTTMSQQMCQQNSQDFIYPQVCELKFTSVKQGVYLLDNGLSLFLYISKICDPSILKLLFGKDKLVKNQVLSEQNILDSNQFALQVTNLVRVCREQKAYGWVPLYVVRCGDNSFNQKSFYMNFYAEKYDQYRSYKMTLTQFISLLSQKQ